MTNASLKQLYRTCLVAIGGRSNGDVRWYLKERPKRISRQAFFQNAVWAIWVSGMRRTTTKQFLRTAEAKGFSWDFAAFGSWNARKLTTFVETLHGRPTPRRASAKWRAARTVARELLHYQNERDFREGLFGGKAPTSELDHGDVARLIQRHLPFIGSANAHFIIRNIGGEAIKCDRWIRAFLRHYRISLEQLTSRVRALSIRPGLFDVVMWAYCEKCVKRVSLFGKHFSKMGRL